MTTFTDAPLSCFLTFNLFFILGGRQQKWSDGPVSHSSQQHREKLHTDLEEEDSAVSVDKGDTGLMSQEQRSCLLEMAGGKKRQSLDSGVYEVLFTPAAEICQFYPE